MNPAAGVALREARNETRERSPLAQLLHGLNQPLTGLQCSMEVALASPRTLVEYKQILRTGLELTERMRTLAEAMREVVELRDETSLGTTATGEESPERTLPEQCAKGETTEFSGPLLESIEDLRPIAESKGVRLVLEAVQSRFIVRIAPDNLRTALFRTLDSVLQLTAQESALSVQIVAEKSVSSLCIRWNGRHEELRSVPSRAEIGLLVARAQWEHCRAGWKREAGEDGETLLIRLPRNES